MFAGSADLNEIKKVEEEEFQEKLTCDPMDVTVIVCHDETVSLYWSDVWETWIDCDMIKNPRFDKVKPSLLEAL